MTVADARTKAESAIANAQQMNASHEHPPSKAIADMASTVIDLCSQIETLEAQIVELRASKKAKA